MNQEEFAEIERIYGKAYEIGTHWEDCWKSHVWCAIRKLIKGYDMKKKKANEPKLCYVKDQWAYFTDLPLSEVDGDGWNKRPYEHNTYAPSSYTVKLCYEGSFETPAERGGYNSSYCVEEINNGFIPWLTTSRWDDATPVVIPAGTTLSEFKLLIKLGGGKIYVEEKE